MRLDTEKVYDGKVTGITKYGAFVEIEPGTTGMVHISEVASSYVSDIKAHLTEGQEVKVRVISVSQEGKIALSIKKALRQQRPNDKTAPSSPNAVFEEMLNKFKQNSDDKMCDLKRTIDNKRKSPSRRK